MACADRHRWAMAALVALAAHGAGAVAPPVSRIDADCERPTYASDRVVCDDAALLALDRRLRDTWLGLSAVHAVVAPTPLLEPQEAWFARRGRCAFVEAHAACLQAAYRDRARVLDAWGRGTARTLAGPGTAVRCIGHPSIAAAATLHRLPEDLLMLTDRAGRVLAIASPGAGQDGWAPFLRGETDVQRLVLRPLSGTEVSCTPD